MAALCCTTTSNNINNVGLTGDTIEEKTRCLLGWTKDSAPSYYTDAPLLTQISSSGASSIPVPAPVPGQVTFGTALSQPRKSPRGCRTRAQTSSASGTGPVGGPSNSTVSVYPYSLLTFQSNKGHYSNQGRKNSCPANLCDLDAKNTAAVTIATTTDQLTPPPSPPDHARKDGTSWAGSRAPTMGARSIPTTRFGPVGHQQQHPSMSRRHSLDSGHLHSNLDQQKRTFDFISQHQRYHFLPISPVSPKSASDVMSASAPTRNLSPVGEIFGQTGEKIIKNNSKFHRFLFRNVANVIDLETKLTQLNEEATGGPHREIAPAGPFVDYCDNYGPSSDVFSEFSHTKNNDNYEDLSSDAVDIPDDLACIDVTAFKSLMLEGETKSRLDRRQFQNIHQYPQFQPIFSGYNDIKPIVSFEKYANLDALSVDTSF